MHKRRKKLSFRKWHKKKPKEKQRIRRSWLYRNYTISGKPSIHIVASEVKNSKFPGANQLAICKCDCIRIWTRDKQGIILPVVREWIKLGSSGSQFQKSNRSATLPPRLSECTAVLAGTFWTSGKADINTSFWKSYCLNRHCISIGIQENIMEWTFVCRTARRGLVFVRVIVEWSLTKIV